MRFFKNENGSALLLIMVIIVVLTVIGSAVWQREIAEIRSTELQVNKTKAYYIARSGADMVAEYIMENHSDISSISGWSNSESVFLGEGEFQVKVTGSLDDKLEIESTGIVEDVQEVVNIILVNNAEETTKIPDKVVFSELSLSFEGSADTSGEIATNSIDTDSIYFHKPQNFAGTLYVGPTSAENLQFLNDNINVEVLSMPEEINYLPINFPEVDESSIPVGIVPESINNSEETINQSGTYNSLLIKNNGTLNFNITDNEDIIIVTDSFTNKGEIVINRDAGAKGQVKIFTDSFENKGVINSEGAQNDLSVYYTGDSTLTFSGNGSMNGNLFVKSADLVLTGTSNYYGNIYSNGKSVEMKGNFGSNTHLLYAPQSTITTTGSVSFTGAIIAENFTATGNTSLTFVEPDLDEPLPVETGGEGGGFYQKYWQ